MPGTGFSVGVASVSMYAIRNSANKRVACGVVHQPITRQIREVAETLVAGVEQPQLHQLIRRDVVDHQYVDLLQRRTAIGEIVLEHPRRERFRGHRPLIRDAELVLHDGDDVGCGDRGDAVHHRVGEPGVRAHPFTEARMDAIGIGGERVAGHLAVALDVVAGHDRRRCDAAVATTRQRLDATRPNTCTPSPRFSML